MQKHFNFLRSKPDQNFQTPLNRIRIAPQITLVRYLGIEERSDGDNDISGTK
jgi:hypothetical protein